MRRQHVVKVVDVILIQSFQFLVAVGARPTPRSAATLNSDSSHWWSTNLYGERHLRPIVRSLWRFFIRHQAPSDVKHQAMEVLLDEPRTFHSSPEVLRFSRLLLAINVDQIEFVVLGRLVLTLVNHSSSTKLSCSGSPVSLRQMTSVRRPSGMVTGDRAKPEGTSIRPPS